MAQIGKIRLSPWLLALLGVGILLNEGLMLGVGLLCVLAHEGGYILMARRFGARTERVNICPFGGVAEIQGLYDLSPWEETEVALAGPLVSVLLASLCGFLAHIFPKNAGFLDSLMLLNGSLAMFNLLPIFPLDGSRIVSRITEGKRGERLIARLLTIFGLGFGLLLVLLGALFGLANGRVNVTWMLCGAYIIYENIKRRKAQPFAQMRRTAAREGLLYRKRIVKVQQFAAKAGISETEILRHLPGGVLCKVTWLDENGSEISAKFL